MSTKMAASQPWHFDSRGKLPKSEQTCLVRRHTQDICTRDQTSRVCRAGPPIDGLWGRFHTCHQGCQHIYQKDPEGWSTPLSRYNWGRLQTTTETAELHTPECCSVPHWSPLASATRGSALLNWGVCLPSCPPGSGDPSLQDADNSLAHCAVSQTYRLRLWDLVCYRPLIVLSMLSFS